MNKGKNMLKEKVFKAVPDEYRLENEKQGVIESLYYNVPNLEKVLMLSV